MNSLPSTPHLVFETQLGGSTAPDSPLPRLSNASDTQETQHASSQYDDDDVDDMDDTTFVSFPNQCLFCLSTLDSINDNRAHMATSHSFQIPNIQDLQTDVEVLLGYLALTINRFHSCLFCDRSKSSAEAIRAHMLDKGHCMLDMSPASEYLKFWNISDEEKDDYNHLDGTKNHTHSMPKDTRVPRILSSMEMLLLSGAITSDRHHHSRTRNSRPPAGSSNETSLVETSQRDTAADPRPRQRPRTQNSQELSLRDQAGVVGLSDFERRSLLAVQKKLRAREWRDGSARAWSSEKGGNEQKHYKVSSGSWRLPWQTGRKNG